MTKPITPDEIGAAKLAYLPEAVIKVWNGLIAKNWSGRSATVKQSDAVGALMLGLVCSKNDVYENKYLDIEDVYREAGWKVAYDKPGYNESYSATYEFSRK